MIDPDSPDPLSAAPQDTPPTSPPLKPVVSKTFRSKGEIFKRFLTMLLLLIIAAAIAGAAVYEYKQRDDNKSSSSSVTTSVSKKSKSETATAVVTSIPASIDPVNPAALPLGDGKVSKTPEVGYVDSCITSFSGTGGASVDGPWINEASSTWNSVSKVAVAGSVSWPNAQYSVSLSGSNRLITGNDLPVGHTSGVFPIASSDPAHAYDQNPNSIMPQSIKWTLPANPTAATNPSCTSGGPVGILNDGVLLFNALDGEGRDAGAHEVLDSYQGHPDMSGMYHHHVLPTFLSGTSASKSTSTLIGYAIDGYGIYVERDANGNLLTNANLDACHGRTSEVMWNGKMTDIYHYDATLEYPYTISCFHGTPITTNVQMKMN